MKKFIWSLIFILPLFVMSCGGGGSSSSDDDNDNNDNDNDNTNPVADTYSVSGTVSVQIGTLDGVTLTLTAADATTQTATSGTDGTFSVASVEDGTYTLTPSKTDFVFTPANLAVTVSAANVTAQDFVAAIDDTTFTIAFNTVAGGDTDVYTMTLDGENRTRLTTDTNSSIPRFSSDKTKILYDADNLTKIDVMNADGTSPVDVTGYAADPAEPSFASDGSVVLFSATSNDGFDIFSVPADGSADPTQLTALEGDSWGTVVFPGGDECIFTSSLEFGERHTVYKMNIDGSALTDLTPNETTDAQYAAISGDGTKIAYTGAYMGEGTFDIFLMDADGSNLVNISADADHENQSPSISYDGTKVVFDTDRPDAVKTTYTEHASEIYIADADGTNLTQLTNTTATNTDWFNYRPQFLRDGRILFLSMRADMAQIYVMNPDGTEQTKISDGSTNDNEGLNGWDKPSF